MKIVVAAIIEKEGRVLVAQRATGPFAGKWEFPGGKVEEDETPQDALEREIREELQVEVLTGALAGEAPLQIGDTPGALVAYRAAHVTGDFKPTEHSRIDWVPIGDLPGLDLAPADRVIAAQLAVKAEPEAHPPAPDGGVPAAESKPALSRARRREQAVCDALRALLRDHYMDAFGLRAALSGTLPMSLQFEADPDNGWTVRFVPPLTEQVLAQEGEAQAMREAFQRGRVYCFRCASAVCSHSTPPTPLSVFRGFSSTGTPDWFELVQALVDARNERVDQLYAKPPAVLAQLQYGRELKAAQLSVFGRTSKTYAVLAQVVAGFFRLPARLAAAAGSDRMAVTFQAVETRDRLGGTCLHLNPIFGGVAIEDWDQLLADDWSAAVAEPLADAAGELADLQQRVRAGGAARSPENVRAAMARVPSLLRRLALALERGGRQSQRRTRHVQERRLQQRPVHKAMEDARVAGDGDLFMDERRSTWVACGKNGRTHVFSAEGKHITSFIQQSGSAEFRVRTRRWRPLDAAERTAFRQAIRNAQAVAPGTAEDPARQPRRDSGTCARDLPPFFHSISASHSAIVPAFGYPTAMLTAFAEQLSTEIGMVRRPVKPGDPATPPVRVETAEGAVGKDA